MKKIAIIAATAALFATSSIAMAEENLETTGNRNAGLSNYSEVLLAQRAPARSYETRRHYNQAPVAAQSRSAEENWFNQADRLSTY